MKEELLELLKKYAYKEGTLPFPQEKEVSIM